VAFLTLGSEIAMSLVWHLPFTFTSCLLLVAEITLSVPMHHIVKAYSGRGGKHLAFFTLILYETERSASCTVAVLVVSIDGRLSGPRICSGMVVKRDMPFASPVLT
jgi:hypothetical protein